jgi:hypothetical protein
MNILGIDIGRNSATVCALHEYPEQPLRYFQTHRKEIIKLKADEGAISKILDLKPIGIVMEPTGIWYSNFWKHLATFHKIPIYWIGHGDLAAQRKSYGFRNKRDDEDAFALALTYIDNRFVNVHGEKRYLDFATGTVTAVRDAFFEAEQLDKLLNALINQTRQRLASEFPELCQRKTIVTAKLGHSPMWGYLAGKHKYSAMTKLHDKSVAKSVGLDLTEYTKLHAEQICTLEKRLLDKETQLKQLLALPEFELYLKVFKRFRFGIRNQALMLVQCYPFERFLLDGKPWIDYEEGCDKEGNPKMQKRPRSLRSFQLFLGLGYVEKQSGDKSTKALGGSEVCRSQLYAWVMTSILPKRYDSTWLNQQLNKKSGDGWTLDKLRESKISGKQKIIRILFKVTRLLFNELKQENELLKNVG